MTTTEKLGNILLDYIDNDKKTSKDKVILELEKFKKEQQDISDKEIENKTKYMVEYENPRIEQNALYESYYNEREDIYNEWKNKKTAQLLYDLVHIKQPVLKEIPDIYTYNYIKRKERSGDYIKPVIPKSEIIPKKKVVKEPKEKVVKEPKEKVVKEPKEKVVKEKITKKKIVKDKPVEVEDVPPTDT